MVDLFRVDLSAVVSQYIGETEQNLNAVFDKAEASGAILFFDEADALFGTGSNANDAHDQYANAETAHFLQRIESHNGIVILTTRWKATHRSGLFSPDAGGRHGGDDGDRTDEEEVSVRDSGTTDGTSKTGGTG